VVGVDPASLALGAQVKPLADSGDVPLVVGCGRPLADVAIEIVDESGEPMGQGRVGEVVIRGRSVTAGYLAGSRASPTSFGAGGLRTGDAGFVLDSQLFVLGRLGDSMKLRGRTVFAEDLEATLVSMGLPGHRIVVLLGVHAGVPTAVAVLEAASVQWLADAAAVLRRRTEGAHVVLVDAPRGTIERTSSGKAKRRPLWRRFTAQELPGEIHDDALKSALLHSGSADPPA
jgi:acyl-CoA synthetase (AMP-forming)/AMP-acid ligase II